MLVGLIRRFYRESGEEPRKRISDAFFNLERTPPKAGRMLEGAEEDVVAF